MRYIQLHTEAVISDYAGDIPLSHYLKAYFRNHRKLGSRDRKLISEMTYCWYRCSKAFPEKMTFTEKMQACLFMCETSVAQIPDFLPEHWKQGFTLPLSERTEFLQAQGINWNPALLFPSQLQLSDGISKQSWQYSMLLQPSLFIRIRDHKEQALALLDKNNIKVLDSTHNCISLSNGSPVDKILPPDWYVVQDASSQSTGIFFRPKKNESWWDCCSGAGGKSLLLKDIQPDLRLTVSDKRAGILHNLTERFRNYHHRQPEKIVTDVTDEEILKKQLKGRTFDHIICDVPCSGSGTWARTPEQAFFFKELSLDRYTTWQQQITVNAFRYLKKGGRMIYITCSVFEKENEAVIRYFLQHSSAALISSRLINGINNKADSMFIAVLQK